MLKQHLSELAAHIAELVEDTPAHDLFKSVEASLRDEGLAENDDPRPIVVVGAGSAGLAAAKALQNAGKQVIVLEGRDRIGGRTHTDKVGAATLDLGGAWIHGDEDNPMAEFAVANGLTYTPHEAGLEVCFDSVSGEMVSKADMAALNARLEGAWLAMITTALRQRKDASIADAVGAYLDSADFEGDDRRRGQFAMEVMASASAGALDAQSFWGMLKSESGFEGGDHIIAGGYVGLVDLLADGLDIRLDTPVETIEHSEGGVRVGTPTEEIEASHVIVTVPLGVLKSGAIAFLPPLGGEKARAIERLGMGSFEKVVLVFEERFWRDRFESSLLFLSGHGADRRFPYFVDLTDHAGAPTLVCIYAGRFAEQAQATMSEDALCDGALNALEQALGDDIPAPVAVRATTWTTSPFSQGSYSFLAVGASADDYRALAEPVGDRLLFAGEATNVEHSATVHGAFLSGLREARRLVRGASL